MYHLMNDRSWRTQINNPHPPLLSILSCVSIAPAPSGRKRWPVAPAQRSPSARLQLVPPGAWWSAPLSFSLSNVTLLFHSPSPYLSDLTAAAGGDTRRQRRWHGDVVACKLDDMMTAWATTSGVWATTWFLFVCSIITAHCVTYDL